jgi:hypothetical protein
MGWWIMGPKGPVVGPARVVVLLGVHMINWTN